METLKGVVGGFIGFFRAALLIALKAPVDLIQVLGLLWVFYTISKIPGVGGMSILNVAALAWSTMPVVVIGLMLIWIAFEEKKGFLPLTEMLVYTLFWVPVVNKDVTPWVVLLFLFWTLATNIVQIYVATQPPKKEKRQPGKPPSTPPSGGDRKVPTSVSPQRKGG